MWANGHLMEIVDLKGSNDGLREEDLENFIQSFPSKGVHDDQNSPSAIRATRRTGPASGRA
jgi:hypothetical protein